MDNTFAIVFGAVVTFAVPLFFSGVRKVLSRPFTYLHKSITLPHTLDTQIGALTDTLSRVEDKTDMLVGQMIVNGGKSLADTINLLLLQSFIESRSRQKLMSAYGYAFWESDRNGKCTFASQALADLLGMSPDDALGDGWITNLKPDEREFVTHAWQAAVQEKRRFTANYTFLHEDGTEVRVQGQSFPILHNGKVEGFVGILTEI